MAALRELVASFDVSFDKAGNLGKGDKAISGLAEKLTRFGKYVAGAFAVTQIFEFGRSILDQADVLAKQSQALGVSTEQLQGWQHAAALSGSSAEEFAAAFTKFTRNVNEASESASGNAAKAFKSLGVTVKDASGKLGAPIDLLDGVVAGLEGIQDPAKRTALVMDLFGKSGARLLPLLSEGPEGLKKLRAEVGELGASFDDAFLENAQEVNDNVDRLKLGVKGLAIQIIGPILPGLVKLTQVFISGAKSLIGWIKGGKVLQAALATLAGNGIYKLLTSIPALVARFGTLQAILLRVGVFVARFIAPFLILEDIFVFLAGGKSAIGKGLDAAFGPGTAKNIQALVAEMVKFFGLFKTEPNNVRAAFSSLPKDLERDLGGFGSFLGGWGQNIVEVGLFAVNALTGGWQNFVSKAKAAGDGFLLAIKIIWTELKFAGLETAAAMSDAFDGVWNSIIGGAQAALGAMLDVLAKLPGTGDAVKALRANVAELDSARGNGDAGAIVGRQHDRERLAIAAEGDRIGAVATAPAGAGAPAAPNTTTITGGPVTNQITVNVPPGDGELGARVGRATGKATGDATLRATKAALVPTAG